MVCYYTTTDDITDNITPITANLILPFPSSTTHTKSPENHMLH